MFLTPLLGLVGAILVDREEDTSRFGGVPPQSRYPGPFSKPWRFSSKAKKDAEALFTELRSHFMAVHDELRGGGDVALEENAKYAPASPATKIGASILSGQALTGDLASAIDMFDEMIVGVRSGFLDEDVYTKRALRDQIDWIEDHFPDLHDHMEGNPRFTGPITSLMAQLEN